MEPVSSSVPCCNCSPCCGGKGAFSVLIGFSSNEDADESSAWPSSPGFFLLEVAPSLVSWVPPFDLIIFSGLWSGTGEGIRWGNSGGMQACESQDLDYVLKERIYNK